jgi:hypothetical protein
MTGPDVSGTVDAAAKRVKELSDQVTAQAKKNGLEWLEGYEKVLKNLLDLEEQAAKTSGVDWAATLATSHANFVRETSVDVRGRNGPFVGAPAQSRRFADRLEEDLPSKFSNC